MKKLMLLLVITLPVILMMNCCEFSPDVQMVENEITDILGRQKISWNEENIEGFMEYYWNSEKFTFQSGKKGFMAGMHYFRGTGRVILGRNGANWTLLI